MSVSQRLLRYSIRVSFAAVLLCSRLGSAQAALSKSKPDLFKTYFEALATEPHTQRRSPFQANYEKLIQTIPTMTDAELQQAVSIIDTAIDQARISRDGIARVAAGMLLWQISGTKDGPNLLSPEVSHLSALCSDPFTLTGSAYLLIRLAGYYPELSVPAMLEAIKAPDANSSNGKGPAYATILFIYPRDGGLLKQVLVYMQRPDLTGSKLLELLSGIRASDTPDAVVEQLISYLSSPQEDIRLAALQDISRAGFDERKRLRPMFQQLADDPAQSAAFHKLAVELLDSNRIFGLDPYQ